MMNAIKKLINVLLFISFFTTQSSYLGKFCNFSKNIEFYNKCDNVSYAFNKKITIAGLSFLLGSSIGITTYLAGLHKYSLLSSMIIGMGTIAVGLKILGSISRPIMYDRYEAAFNKYSQDPSNYEEIRSITSSRIQHDFILSNLFSLYSEEHKAGKKNGSGLVILQLSADHYFARYKIAQQDYYNMPEVFINDVYLKSMVDPEKHLNIAELFLEQIKSRDIESCLEENIKNNIIQRAAFDSMTVAMHHYKELSENYFIKHEKINDYQKNRMITKSINKGIEAFNRSIIILERPYYTSILQGMFNETKMLNSCLPLDRKITIVDDQDFNQMTLLEQVDTAKKMLTKLLSKGRYSQDRGGSKETHQQITEMINSINIIKQNLKNDQNQQIQEDLLEILD